MNSILKKALIVVVVLAVLAVGGWFGRKAYKRTTERRAIAQATEQLKKGEFRNASVSLRRALQVNPLSCEAAQRMADLFEAGGAPAALTWRIRAAELQPENVELRFAWVQTALVIQDYRSAATALRDVKEIARETATYHKLAGALAWGLQDATAAEDHYARAQRLDPTNHAMQLNLATIRLASTNAATAQAARTTLEQMSTNANLRSTALHHLVSDAVSQKSFSRALAFSKQIVQNTNAPVRDQIAHLQLLQQAQDGEFDAYQTRLKTEATHSPVHAFGVGRWMYATQGPTNTLRWLQSLPASVQTNQPVPLLMTDCQIVLKDWRGLLATVNKQDWDQSDYYRYALEALARRSAPGAGSPAETLATQTAWQKSFRLSHKRLDRLTALAKLAAAWGWKAETTQVLLSITADFPRERWALAELISRLHEEGKTRDIQQALAKGLAANPADNQLKNNLANVNLLQKTNLDTAHRMAKEVYDAAPDNPFFCSTYAYSLLLQQNTNEALKVLAGVNTNYLQIPAVAAYHGVVHAYSGQKATARVSLARADGAKLLPEEKEIVRLAKTRL